jgi:hypothetical protein
MGNSYPDRTNASGVWKINEISKNKVTHNTYPDGSKRALFGGGNTGSASDIIEHIQLVSTGNGTDFGNLSVARRLGGTAASSTRAVFANGSDPATDVIDYVQYATLGNASDFGDAQTSATTRASSMCNGTRGIWGGGDDNPNSPRNIDILDYITIATTGDAADFGNLSVGRWGTNKGIISSTTRGITAGGATPTHSNVIDYVTINTLGNAIDFGNLTETKYVNAGGSSHTRGLIGGGQDKTSIDVITIASLGNAVGFGDISTANDGLAAANDIQRVAWGGGSVPARVNTIEFVNINSAGNAVDFGDLTAARDNPQGNCGSHGGIRSY